MVDMEGEAWRSGWWTMLSMQQGLVRFYRAEILWLPAYWLQRLRRVGNAYG